MLRGLSGFSAGMAVLIVASSASASTDNQLTRALTHVFQLFLGAITVVGSLALLMLLFGTIWGGNVGQWVSKASNTLILVACAGLISGIVSMASAGGALM